MTLSSPALAAYLAVAARLPLAEKVELLTGGSAWKLRPNPRVGLREVVMSDGPAGVRGTGEVVGETSVLFPAPSALAATWDIDLADELGAAFAQEARGHGVDVVLAPQVNLQRTPVGGRHFECYSEDPLLTSVIGTSVVVGLQRSGVAASIKHYIANDSETDRTTYIARLDERTLREVYLAPFEHAVRHGVWSIMAAYNRVESGGETAHMTAHRRLVNDLLKDEFGFDGVVVSDWMATKDAVASALGGLDLVMPGPGGPYDEHLLKAVEAGIVPESEIDEKVARILLLAERVGALGNEQAGAGKADMPDLARRIAAQSTVVLRRDDEQPVWDRREPASIALIGPNAVRLHVMGGGSSVVNPGHLVSLEEGLRARFSKAELRIARGGNPRRLTPLLDVKAESGGVDVAYLDAAGEVIALEHRDDWDGWMRDIADGVERVALRLEVLLEEPGEHRIEVGTVGGHRIVIDGVLVSEEDTETGAEVILNSTINNPPGVGRSVVVGDEPRRVVVEAEHKVTRAGGYGGLVRSALRHGRPEAGDEAEIAEAVAAAAASELVVVVVGTNEEVESEGWDRTSLQLPGRQNELVEAVLDVAPSAVIVVNAGAPVILPWLDRAGTVLWTWFPGQQAGDALAAVLAGDEEPAGRLTWTLPADEADVPVPHALPVDGFVDYAEGLHVGYRAWEQPERAVPAAPFGSGLGWSSWSYESLNVLGFTADGDLELEVTLTNTGARASRETVQVYLEPPVGGPERPVRWLAGFAGARLAAGETRCVTVVIPRRQFEVWDIDAEGWTVPPGEYPVRVGRSIRELLLHAAVRLDSSGSGKE
jgi:beta-glucosidase